MRQRGFLKSLDQQMQRNTENSFNNEVNYHYTTTVISPKRSPFPP